MFPQFSAWGDVTAKPKVIKSHFEDSKKNYMLDARESLFSTDQNILGLMFFILFILILFFLRNIFVN